MHNAADDPAFIHSRFSRECRSADAVQAARIDRHSARNDLDPLQVPPSGTLNQKMRWLGIPFMGPHPNTADKCPRTTVTILGCSSALTDRLIVRPRNAV